MLKALWLYLIVIVALVWAAVALRPPVPLAASAPPSVFSAGRAMDDVRAIALRPHPTGSEDIGRVRAYVLQRLAGLGLGGEVHVGQGVRQVRGDASRLSAGSVQNLIVVLSNTSSSTALPAVDKALQAAFANLLSAIEGTASPGSGSAGGAATSTGSTTTGSGTTGSGTTASGTTGSGTTGSTTSTSATASSADAALIAFLQAFEQGLDGGGAASSSGNLLRAVA